MPMQDNSTLLLIINNQEHELGQLIRPEDLLLNVNDYIDEMPSFEVPKELIDNLMKYIYS